MADLPFNEDLIDTIRDNRTDVLTSIFQFFTFLGNEMGYILIILGFYWLYSKNFALRLTMVLIASSTLNHLLKIIIKNPRPYVADGTYEDNWAISSDVEETASEYSTPSGHAMGAMSFWTYIHHKFRSTNSLVLALIMILLIGLSRPYLGVHFLEDILLGWILGFALVFLIMRYEHHFISVWQSVSQTLAIGALSALSFGIALLAGIVTDFGVDGERFATLGGMFTGLIIGYHLEISQVGFTEKSTSLANGVSKYVLGIIISLGTLTGLDLIFAALADDESFLGYILRFVRYAALGIVATFVAGKLFVRTGLADSEITRNPGT